MQSLQPPEDRTVSFAPNGKEHSTSEETVEDGRKLRMDLAAMRDRFTKLSEATLRINAGLDLDGVLQEVIDSARALTGAKYGILVTYDGSGNVTNVASSGFTQFEAQQVREQPSFLGLPGYMNEVLEPLRTSDISSHPEFVGFPEYHPPMKTFLGMQIRNHGEHLGNIFLTGKLDEQEFTPEDEETLVMFASQATHAISSARRYHEVNLAKADMEALIDISPIGVGVYNAKSSAMVSYNLEMRRIVGNFDLTIEDAEPEMGMLTYRRADGRVIPLQDTPVARVMLTGETVRADDITLEFPDGRSVSTLFNAAPIFADSGEIATVVVAVQDMARLEDAEKVRAEFLGMVSQELRAPLATIKGSAAALGEILRALNPTESLQLLRIIDQQADLMRAQINSLIELTQIQAGAMSIAPEVADVSDLVEMASLEFQRSHSGSSVDARIPSGLPPVTADRDRISQVMKNLFSEIVKFSATTHVVQVSASLLDIYVAISVSFDSKAAPGDAFVGRSIFPAESGERDLNQYNSEKDLTLAFCRGIVEAHGGRIRAQCGERGFGTVYTFTLPIADEAAMPTTESSSETPSLGIQPGTDPRDRAKVLVAIPDARTMGTVRRILLDADFSTVATTNLDEMERLVTEQRPNIVVLDLSDSEQTGFELTHHLSNELGISVIVLSEKGDDQNVAQAFEMGADDYLAKPFSATELVVRMRSSLKKKASQRGNASVSGYAYGDVAINYGARTLTVSEATVPLTATEYKLLYELSKNAGRILTQDELLHRVWGPEYTGEPQLLRSYVKSLRHKLADNARSPSYIFTEHGIGYRMAKHLAE